MSHPPLYDERPAQRRRGRSSERSVAVIAVVVAIVAVLVAVVLGVLLVMKPSGTATTPAAAAASAPAARPTSAPSRRPVQPKTRGGARAAAQKAFDLYTTGQYGPFWDRWTSGAQRLVSRRDYVRRFKLCPNVAEGLRFTISAVSVTGNHAKVTAARSIATFVFDFLYERGAWRYLPPADQQQEYQTKSVDQIVREERAAGTCG
ncbi:hypothetical protein [Microbispora sp. NPDC049125]|uniref:hypothetical protein n=1 Tax=Microbispora sp. NPDC049125 TaxID=3154929 RepID=UPI0034677810